MTTSTITHTQLSSVSDFLRDLLLLPVWWYTRGFLRFAVIFFAPVHFLAEYWSIPVLAANLAQPLFGDVSRSGRLLSVCVRLGHFLLLFGILLLLTILVGFLYLVWMSLPILSCFQLLRLIGAQIV